VFSPLLLSGRDPDDAYGLEPGVLRDYRGIAARGRVEDEEADLVLWNVDRAVEADGCPFTCELLRGRAGAPLTYCALACLATSEIGLDEETRHALDARARAMPRKRQNV
jgi:hypothetical protein